MSAPLTRAFALSLLPVCLATVRADGPAAKPPGQLDYNRDVRPILRDACFACHGPDAKQRKADLRLDQRDAAVRHGALVPGKSGESEVYQRLVTDEKAKRMPPAKFGKSLSPDQVATLKRWIDEGASYAEHWAYVPPRRPALPTVQDAAWPRNAIDRFVLARLEREGLSPSPLADKVTLIRRVTLDLTGLPPTPAEVDAFLADHSPTAYEKVVDRLLRSARYGEHMARYWLDLARFGDTHGLHLDNYREMWPYRDWVINALNKNLPYDRFVTKQLAGDLLPGGTTDDLVATGFNRAHVTTSEGGSITEEIHVRNVVDRVETTGTVLLGLTVGCARCHDHKYDPVTMKDFYSLSAYFNSLEGSPLDGNEARHPPTIKVPTPDQAKALALAEKKLAEARRELGEKATSIAYDDTLDANEPERPKRGDFVWIDDAVPAGAKPEAPWTFVKEPVHSGALSLKMSVPGFGQHVFSGAKPGLKVGAGDKLFAWVFIDPTDPPREIMLQWHTDTWRHRAFWGDNLVTFGADNTDERRRFDSLPQGGKWVKLEVPAASVGLKPGQTITGWAFTQHGGTVYWDRAGINTEVPQSGAAYDTLSAWVRVQRATKGAGLPANVQAILKADRAKRTAEQKKELTSYFVQHAWSKSQPLLAPLRDAVARVQADRDRLDQSIPVTYVFREASKPIQAYILKRGEYDQRGAPVGRAALSFLSAGKDPADRLGLANWLLSPENPLPARVAVNRFWQQMFGVGLVKTAEDFGVQGEPPSHPELLDWLAVEFRESGWDVKRLLKLLVMSATYQQSAKATKDRLAKDPTNRLLSRGARHRLDAEVLRDQALAVSGLLVEKVGGPSVKPPQPPGLWKAVAFVGSNTMNFVADKGPEKVHRRSLYTFWKRTAPPPQMSTFDAPSREACVARRERTNTPLQALLLLNDPQYVECARVLAQRVLREKKTTDERLVYLFRLATSRAPDAAEKAELAVTLLDLLTEYQRDPASAKRVLAVGEAKPDLSLPAHELAAWAMLASTVLNLDEVINKG
ncbi:MAG: PSD1 and planctomycete cytochrome C domain-containing protein [Gemmataceae bacterium]